MLQRDCFGKHLELVVKATRAVRRSYRRVRALCPFQLDLFVKRIPVGKIALSHLSSGTRLLAPSTALRVVFKFIRNGSYFFAFNNQLFSLSATDAALLEF